MREEHFNQGRYITSKNAPQQLTRTNPSLESTMDFPSSKPQSDRSPYDMEEPQCDTIAEPQPAHIRDDQQHHTDTDDELEATELRPIIHDKPRLSRVITPDKPMVRWYDPVRRFWRHQIRVSVPHVDCRDHLANERTFLGYLRTSIALSMIGVLIAQLYRLEHRANPSKVFGYFVLSKPLAVIFQSAALAIVLMGSVRYYRQQGAMTVGKVHAGGWEVLGTGVGTLILLFMLFVVHVAVDIYKQEEGEP